MDRKRAMQGIILTMAAWGCWEAMEFVPDYSPVETTLFISGFVLVGLALVVFYLAFRTQKS